jgi:hypothetical protein
MDSTRAEVLEEIATLHRVADTMKKNLTIVCSIKETIGKVSNQTILSMDKHGTLLRCIMRSNCRKFNNVESAIKSVGKSEILINFTEVDLYGVYALNDYVKFLDNLKNASYAYDVEYNPTQVVFESWQQKIVFLCSPSKGDVIKKHASIYFRSEIEIIEKKNITEITVLNKLMSNLNESNKSFYDFLNFMKNQLTNTEIAELDIKLPYISYSNEVEKKKYFTCNLKQHMELNDIQELATVLKSGGFLQVNGDNNNVHHNNITIIINVNTVSAVDWIKANPPKLREEKVLYHQRYIEAGGKSTASVFGKEVIKNGYASCHSGDKRYYK